MPIHDWTKASAGYFLTSINVGLAPSVIPSTPGFFPGESLRWSNSTQVHWCPTCWRWKRSHRMIATGQAAAELHWRSIPPNRFVCRAAEETVYAARANRIALHGEDETIAVIEIVSPGNKSSAFALQQFVDKSFELLDRGIHLLVVDLFPPSRRGPQGIHPAIWARVNGEAFTLPADKQLTLASYVAGLHTTAYIEPVAVDDLPPSMPVFLDGRTCIRVPLEETCEAPWKLCPEEFRQRIIGA